jgi:hypothetical protein
MSYGEKSCRFVSAKIKKHQILNFIESDSYYLNDCNHWEDFHR